MVLSIKDMVMLEYTETLWATVALEKMLSAQWDRVYLWGIVTLWGMIDTMIPVDMVTTGIY